MSVIEIVGWIHRRGACGSLTLENDGVVRTFRFRAQKVVGASSNIDDEHLGMILRLRGLVDEATLDEAFRVQGDTGVLLGKILIMIGAIDEAGLARVLEQKTVDAIADVLRWSDGEFFFDPEEHSELPASEFHVSLPIRDGLRRAREIAERWRAVEEIVPNPDCQMWIVDPERAESLTVPRISELMKYVEQALTVREMSAELQRPVLEVAEAIAELIAVRAIALERRTRPRTGGRPSTVDDIDEAARGRSAGGDPVGALELARAAVEKHPDDARALVLYRDIERAVVAKLSRELLTRYRVPQPLYSEEELDSISLTDTERLLARNVDGHWDLFSLVRNSTIRDGEALITFKRLADRGIISLS